jgi:hypothetical protein
MTDRISAFLYAYRLSRAAGLGVRRSARLAFSFFKEPKR